jgi:hypothetical protein
MWEGKGVFIISCSDGCGRNIDMPIKHKELRKSQQEKEDENSEI